jgi:hypothetical protein
MLLNLSGSKESIKVAFPRFFALFPHVPKTSKDWILYHMESIQEICEMFKKRAKELVEPIKKLHIVYLINDVLLHTYFPKSSQAHFCRLRMRQGTKLDPFSNAVKEVLPSIMQEFWWSKFQDDAEKNLQHEKAEKVGNWEGFGNKEQGVGTLEG